MKLIDSMVLTDVDDESDLGIIINALNGKICVISGEEKQFIRKWTNLEEITPEGDGEKALLKELHESGFLVQNKKEEEHIVSHILSICREDHKRIAESRGGVVFVVTYMCNFACPYCYENAVAYCNNKILSEEMVDKIFELHHNSIPQIALYGGEPFLPETRKIIEYIISKAPGSVYSATTNGYYLPDYVDLLKKIKVNNIMITLDGTREIHNKTRVLGNGMGTYDQVIKGIEICLSNLIPVKIRMNISEMNMKDCLELREEFIGQYKEEYETGILSFELQPVFQLSPEKKDKIKEKIYYNGIRNQEAPFKYNVITHSVSPILKAFVNNSKKAFKPRYCNCDAESKRLFYDPEGDIYSCILSLKNKTATVGKYFPQHYMKEESILTRNIETVEVCKKCKLKFLCGGGCAYEIMDDKGNVKNPNCTSILNEINNELPQLYKKLILR